MQGMECRLSGLLQRWLRAVLMCGHCRCACFHRGLWCVNDVSVELPNVLESGSRGPACQRQDVSGSLEDRASRRQ